MQSKVVYGNVASAYDTFKSQQHKWWATYQTLEYHHYYFLPIPGLTMLGHSRWDVLKAVNKNYSKVRSCKWFVNRSFFLQRLDDFLPEEEKVFTFTPTTEQILWEPTDELIKKDAVKKNNEASSIIANEHITWHFSPPAGPHFGECEKQELKVWSTT